MKRLEHVFIINPAAGKRDRSRELMERVRAAGEAAGVSCRCELTRQRGHAVQLARAAAQTGGPVRIYACGGDGTLNEAVNGAAGFSNAALTHIPIGSGNDFIKIFGAGALRFSDPEALFDCEERSIDLIDCNGRLAINICSVGLDAQIGLGMADFRRLPFVGGAMAYQLALFRSVIQGVHRPYAVTVDGKALEETEFTLLCVCNGRYYGGGFNPSPKAVPDDGFLEFVIVRAVTRRTVAAVVGKYAKGRAAEFPALITLRRGKEMTVACDRMSMVNLDGERMDADRLSFSLSAKKLRFFYPRGLDWAPK